MTTSSAHPHIEQPAAADILCGKDRALNYKPGNSLFRDIIQAHFQSYKTMSKVDKMKMTKYIVQLMKDEYGSRFLAKSSKGFYYEISDAKARDKVSHALRTARKASTRNTRFPYPHRIRKRSVESSSITSSDASAEYLSDSTDESRDTSVLEGRESVEDREPAVIEQDTMDFDELFVCQRQYLQQLMKGNCSQPTLRSALVMNKNIMDEGATNLDSLDCLPGFATLSSLDGIGFDCLPGSSNLFSLEGVDSENLTSLS